MTHDVYIFTDAKPYFRVKKDGKWTWQAAVILYDGYGNYVIQKIRIKTPQSTRQETTKTIPNHLDQE